ncbi:hypothetical protein F2Q68_00026075 [Brassica cretica]|uniref:Neprosin PEP catalytic domain-containing protein n=2 Tax=Brassica cretica TaxID=69181 RepID=A0ABQ7DSY5_BRACR|nr:hypothetical protein F2Q68_00026075 [Brassica cretica]KAF3580340.1 hypothetical protein DY000_02032179 [Brassica cretica]
MPVRFLTLHSVVRCLMVVLTVMVTNIVEPVDGKVNISGQQKQETEFRLKQLNNQALNSIEMTPSSYPHEVLAEENNAPAPSNDEEQPENIVHPWQLVGECPENTIPIKRITKEDLLRIDDIKNYGKKLNISQPHQFYQPTDTSVDNGHEYAITYVNGGPYRGTKAQINDPKTGNWWLQLNDQELIGYWPKELFTNLADEGASTIEWGGEVVNTKKDGQHTTTEMGSGHFPSEGFGKASSFEVIKIIDMNNGIIDPVGVQTLVSRPTCYDIKTGYDKLYEVFFYYGGPGRNPECL